MVIEKTKLEGVFLVILEPFIDFRGKYLEIFNQDFFLKNGIHVKFIQDDISISTRNVLRGIHGDSETWKLISCLEGKFYLLVVNNDPKSVEYRKWQSFVLSSDNNIQVLVPPKFGNGHLVLSEKAIFHYKQNTYYNPAGQFTIKWDDPIYKFWWPIKTPILSQRDESGYFVNY